MKIDGDYLFEGPRDLVWETLLDPVVLASVLPGCEKLDLVGENEYEGALKIKVGPVQGQFRGLVKLADIQPPEAYTMHVDGQGAPGFVKATGHLRLAPEGEQTRVTYEGDAQVGGRLASVGQRLVESSAKAIIRQSLDGLNAAVKVRAAAVGGEGESSAAPPPELKPPSQGRMAASVAREVARDLIPGPVRIALVLLAVLAVLYLVFAVLV